MSARGDVIFSQGDPCGNVMYIRSGAIQLSVLSHAGKEAIVGTLGSGDFLGEEALAGHQIRLVTARATMASTVFVVPKRQMIRLLHSQHAFSDRFITHMLARNTRLEADLVDQLFNSSEKRLARTLLLLVARYGKKGKPCWVLPRISQEALAEKAIRGELREDHAIRIGGQVMRDNALKLFPKLQRHLWKDRVEHRN